MNRPTRENATAPSAQYAPRAFKWEESDQKGAIPGEERDARRGKRRKGNGGENFRLARRQLPRGRSGEGEQILTELIGRNRRNRRWD